MSKQSLTAEEQAILAKAIAELESEPFQCGTPFFMDWEERRKEAERKGRSPYRLTELWNKIISESEGNDEH